MKSNAQMISTIPQGLLTPAERRLIRNMAGALCQALAISQGNDLVPVLGLGGERTNLEAMASWIHGVMVTEGIVPARETLSLFLAKVERHLSAWREPL
ncbi:hypothetical protein [Mangrovitalea sediminis]|uniref:hypothetical protein n=1 Tax=Mangrovitalea sediminis TaxID=1982043 RepID=UPI000BE4C50A|nr:hypothetical protein [Mangrovitalea sediminis]